MTSQKGFSSTGIPRRVPIPLEYPEGFPFCRSSQKDSHPAGIPRRVPILQDSWKDSHPTGIPRRVPVPLEFLEAAALIPVAGDGLRAGRGTSSSCSVQFHRITESYHPIVSEPQNPIVPLSQNPRSIIPKSPGWESPSRPWSPPHAPTPQPNHF